MPWPVSSAQTLKPRRSTSVWTAAPIAPTFAPAVAASSPRRSADCAAAASRCSRAAHPADRDRAAGVGVEAVELGGDVELDELALAQAARAGDAVHALVVDRDADRAGEVVVEDRARAGAVAGEDLGGDVVQLAGADAGADAAGELAQRLGDDAARGAQRGELLRVVDGHPVILTHRCPRPPSHGRRAATCSSSRSTRSPTAATASRAATATSCSWPAPCPATACGRWSARPRRPTPRRARWRSSSPRRTACRRSPTTRARRGRCCPTSASSRSRPRRSTRRCAGSGGSTGYELEPIVPADEQWRYRNKVEFSFGTGAEGELVCGFHAPGRWNEIVPMGDCKLVSERVNELREQVLAFCRGYGAVGPARPARLPAQPRHPRGPPHRADAGPARHLARQARRRRPDRRRRRRRAVVDADRRPRREHLRRRDARCWPARRSSPSSSAGSTS